MNSYELRAFNSPRNTAKVTAEHNSLCRLLQSCLIPPSDHNYYQIPLYIPFSALCTSDILSPTASCEIQRLF